MERTVSVGVRDDDISRAELREELLDELERRVVLHRERRLVHVAAEVVRVLSEDARAGLCERRDRRREGDAVPVRRRWVEGDLLVGVVGDDACGGMEA